MINETIFDLFENVQVGFLVDSAKAVAGDIRLDSSHFVDDSNIVLNENIKFTTLSTFINDVEEPKLFTRIYCDKEFGVPYISSSEMSEIEPPVNSRFISKTLTGNINQYIIKRGQVLVSAAGTVGSIVLATKELNGVAGTSDILRINVDKETNLGFVFTYLTSSFGANELANLAYGAIIKRVRGFQLAQLKTPIIDNKSILKINTIVLAALEVRENANLLLSKARQLSLELNNLPVLEDTSYEDEYSNGVLNYQVIKGINTESAFRLNSHYYKKVFIEINDNIKNFASNSDCIVNLSKRVFLCYRFPRNFVDSENGIPLIGTRSSLQVRPTEMKYLAKDEVENDDELIIKKNWILLARVGTFGGTFGKVAFAWNNFEGYVASDNIIRIVPNDSAIDPAYLYAYLSSQYGYSQLIQLKHGAAQAALDHTEISNIVVPIPSDKQQKQIGDLVRQAYDLRAEAIRLEDEAQTLLTQALTKE